MINTQTIEKYIKTLIDQNITRFVLYPYGVNGKSIHQVLKNKFNIEPVCIVDNAICQWNTDIISLAEFKRRQEENCYTILTVGKKELNARMYAQLKTFMEEEKIINILDCENYIHEDAFPDFSAFQLKALLGKENYNTVQRQSNIIKVRVLNFSCATWNAIRTICQACQEDAQIDLLVIMGRQNMSQEMMNEMSLHAFDYVSIDKYDIKDDRPDILVISHPYDIFSNIQDCRRYCKLIVAASMQLVRYAHNWTDFFATQRHGFGRFYPDCYLFDSLLYNDIVNAGYGSDRIVEMGNPKFDGIYENVQKKQMPDGWKKLQDKKIILWTTDHGVHDGMITEDVTLDLYGKHLFEYAANHKEIGLIFRPHKTLIHELQDAGLWCEEDLEELKQYCMKSENVVFDDTFTYDAAYSMADAIITDAYCGITCSALPLLKPMLLLYRTKDSLPYHKEIAECTYSAATDEEIDEFIVHVLDEEDPKYELRRTNAAKCVKNFDGKNGWRIKEFLKQKYWSMDRG